MKANKGIIYLLMITLVFTLIPAVSYAASENRITKVVTVGLNDIIDASNAPMLVLDLKDAIEPEDTFYLLLEGAEWAVGTGINEITAQVQGTFSAETTPLLELKKINSTELQVRVKAAALQSGMSIRIPLHTKITGETASITVNNNNMAVSSSTHVFAKTMDSRGKVTAGEVHTATGSAVMADLIIEEPYAQAFSKAVASGKSNKIQIILHTNDYEFALNMPELDVPSLYGIKGFDSLSGGVQNLRKIDAQTLELTLPDTSSKKYTGGFVLSGIVLKTDLKVPAKGVISVTAEGDLIQKTTLNMLQVVDYGIALTALQKEQAASGTSKNVVFTLEEKVRESLIRERSTIFTFTNGAKVKLNQDNKVAVSVNGVQMYFYPIMQDNMPIGFEVPQLPGTAMKYEFAVTLNLPAASEGEVKVAAEGRSLLTPLSVSLLEVRSAVKTAIEPMYLKLGVKDQKGGKITLTETSYAQIRQDASLFIQFEDSPIVLTSLPVVQVTAGDIRLGEPRRVTGGIEIPVIRRSNIASVIEIKNFMVTVNQITAEGAYAVQIGGNALSDFAVAGNIDAIAKGSFMIVSKEGSSASSGQVTFKIGEASYTVNGERKIMDAAPYIKNGRTMLPIKYVAVALGIAEENILWDSVNRTVTVNGSSRIELKISSTSMKVDGVIRTMSAPPEISNGRTFVPVAEITRALSVQTTWNENLRTVVFN